MTGTVEVTRSSYGFGVVVTVGVKQYHQPEFQDASSTWLPTMDSVREYVETLGYTFDSVADQTWHNASDESLGGVASSLRVFYINNI